MTRRLRSLAVGLAPMLLLVACTGAPAGSPGSSAASASPSAPASSSAAPSDTPGPVGGNPGLTPAPASGGPGASGVAPGPSPTEVQPVANLLNIHDVRAEAVFTTEVTGGHVRVTAVWWSGPAPCSELSEVKVDRAGNDFVLTVREGAAQMGIACPALAVHKQATVSLGVLPVGTYTVTALGIDTAPITVSVSG